MKFTVEAALSSGGRVGKISQLGKHGNIVLETPLCTLFTRTGSAPYLGLSMLSKISNVPELATMSINSLSEHHENVGKFGKGLGEFTAMKDRIVLTTLHDSSVAIASGKNTKAATAVWSKKGKTLLDPPLFMKIQEALQPDWFQALSDGDTDDTCVRKRLVKAVDRTLDFLDEIVELQGKSEALKNSDLIGVIEGGFDEEERKRSAVETASRPVQGFLIEGFQKGPTNGDVFANEAFASILAKTISFLPEEKPRIMDVSWSPLQVIRGFKCGLDVFSSSYPHTLTEKGQALAIDFSLPPRTGMAKLETEQAPTTESEEEMCLDLKDKRYFDDLSPILRGCECYTCATFTRSYVHHLLNTSELLAYVALTIHNFHKYFEFFQVLKEAARNDQVADLEEIILRKNDSTLLKNS